MKNNQEKRREKSLDHLEVRLICRKLVWKFSWLSGAKERVLAGKPGFFVETASCINRRKFCFHPQSVAVKITRK